MSGDIKKTSPNHNRAVKPEDLQRYASAEYLVDLETNNRMKISDIFVSGGMNEAQRREQQLTIAIHQALHSKSQKSALQDAEGRFLTPMKLDADSVQKVFEAKKQELTNKEKELQEREARLAELEKIHGIVPAPQHNTGSEQADETGIPQAVDLDEMTEAPVKTAKPAKANKK